MQLQRGSDKRFSFTENDGAGPIHDRQELINRRSWREHGADHARKDFLWGPTARM